MTLVPAVLVLHRRQRADPQQTSTAGSTRRWTDILSSANQIASDYYHERQLLVARPGERASRGRCRRSATLSGDLDALQAVDLLAPDVDAQRVRWSRCIACSRRGGIAAERRAGRRRRSRRRCRRAQLRAVVGSPGGAGRRRQRPTRRRIEPLGGGGDLLHAAGVDRARQRRQADRRRGRQRLPDRAISRARVAPHDRGVRGLQPAARAEAAARRASTCRSS